MAVNQAQVDHILSTASADDPEVKLLKLQDEVELLKTSIKRLLIDIRERMNELDNPLRVRAEGDSLPPGSPELQKARKSDDRGETHAVEKKGEQGTEGLSPAVGAAPTPQTINPAPSAPSPMQAPPTQALPTTTFPTTVPSTQDLLAQAVSPGHEGPGTDLGALAALRAGFAALGQPTGPSSRATHRGTDEAGEKVRLRKVFRLFEWTNRNIKRYGHDRVDLMLESFRAMGYISEESCKLVKDISRLMELTLGEQHEIQAEEFVTELYELNRILNPDDITLDRDMLDVLIARRGEEDGERRPLGAGRVSTDGNAELTTRDRI